MSQIEVAKNLPHKIGTEALIETPLGMANVEAIASANSRLESMHFGVADYSAFNKAAPSSSAASTPTIRATSGTSRSRA